MNTRACRNESKCLVKTDAGVENHRRIAWIAIIYANWLCHHSVTCQYRHCRVTCVTQSQYKTMRLSELSALLRVLYVINIAAL